MSLRKRQSVRRGDKTGANADREGCQKYELRR